MYFDVILRIWYKLGSYIKSERKKRKNDIWMMHFIELKNEFASKGNRITTT